MGLGTRGGGVGVARFLVERGAIVTVTDGKPAEALTDSLAALEGLPIRYVLGGHEERDFTLDGADMVVRNPGVPRRAPLLQIARANGVPIEMEMSLFLRHCPAPVIGVTGTKGKTTTATLCAEMLRAWDLRTVLAGNMGVTALGQLDKIGPDTPVVVELSSWQLEALIEHGLAPHIAVLTNISEDHLDHYDGYEEYAATKRGISLHQRPEDYLVVARDDADAWRAVEQAVAEVVPFGTCEHGEDGAWLASDTLVWRWQGRSTFYPRPTTFALAGEHGALNALAALAAARLRGAPPAAIAAGLTAFLGVPNRLEIVAERDGITYVNDTAATAPAAALAAIRTLAGERGKRVHLIAGGADKKSDLSELAHHAAKLAASIHLLDGSATPGFAKLIRGAGAEPSGPHGSMEAAVSAATEAAVAAGASAESEPVDVVLLSPGCASFGLFRDEFDRGDRFRQAVRALDERRVEKSGTHDGGSDVLIDISWAPEAAPGERRPPVDR
jgi:UDP-N-acetylmuramoylalanine--D-glutamate ligase